MRKLIIIRHGETPWNKEKIFRGRANIELSSEGIKQAQLLAKRLESFKIKVIYTSPLKRAKKTAEIIAQAQNIPVKVVNEFIDISYGKWEGLSLKEVEKKDKKFYHKWLTHPEQVKFPQGENLNEVKKRVLPAINKIIEKSKEEVIAIVSHRVVNKIIILSLLGLSEAHFWKIKHDVAAFSVFSIKDNQATLNLHNDSCHLREMGDEIDF